MAFCTACGTALNESIAFCPKCGTAVRRGESSAETGGRAAVVTGVPENVAGMLCYIFVIAIIFLLVEPYSRNRFVRFHAFQSILFSIAWVLMHGVVAIPVIGWMLWPAVELAFLIAWIVLLIKAYQGHMFKLPVIGDFAEQHAG